MTPVDPAEANLTRRQKEILDFVEGFRRREGISPTHREIRDAFGFSSYGTVHKHLRLLREKGVLEREPHRRRGIRLIAAATPAGAEELPFQGRIAAGAPLETVVGDETVRVPDHLLSAEPRDHFVLEVSGQSMVDEGIFDGDLVIVQRREQAAPGEMVVALVDGEATLKRFFPEGATVRLQPANLEMAPMRVPAERVQVQGVVVGLMRRF